METNLRTELRTFIAHENIVCGIFLSLLGGFLDAYSYILKGGVFANAQTGNMVLLALSLVEKDFSKVFSYFVPILMFASGIFISELIKKMPAFGKKNGRVKAVLVFEALIIGIVAFFGAYVSHAAVNCAISFLAAVQVANFDRVNGNPIATTMITGNLRSLTTQTARFLQTGKHEHAEKAGMYLCIIASFAAGVAAGALACQQFGNYSILFCLIFLAAAFTVIHIEEKRIT